MQVVFFFFLFLVPQHSNRLSVIPAYAQCFVCKNSLNFWSELHLGLGGGVSPKNHNDRLSAWRGLKTADFVRHITYSLWRALQVFYWFKFPNFQSQFCNCYRRCNMNVCTFSSNITDADARLICLQKPTANAMQLERRPQTPHARNWNQATKRNNKRPRSS